MRRPMPIPTPPPMADARSAWRRWSLLVAALSLLAAACTTPSPGTSAGPTPDDSAATTPSITPAASLAATASLAPTPVPTPIAGDPPALTVELVADGLASPIAVAGSPEGWLLVNEQAGRVVAVHPDGRTAVAADLSDRVRGGGERGLLGLALHPGWPETPRAFVHYSDLDGDTVVSELAARPGDDETAPSLDPGSERVLLQVDQPYANHNGGQMAFGPDGYLYIGLGDGGDRGDPHANGQNTSALLGKILRIDVDAGATNGRLYGIPPENPFADETSGAPEVFLFGLRNPWRFSFDHQTGLLWVADVGQNALEEINRIDPATQAGANLGWNLMEGSRCYLANCSPEALTLPLAEYGRDLGCSVTGGYVYRADAIPALRGWYLFGDYCLGLVFAVPSDAAQPADAALSPHIAFDTDLAISTFGEGADGTLYVADHRGALYRIAAAP